MKKTILNEKYDENLMYKIDKVSERIQVYLSIVSKYIIFKIYNKILHIVLLKKIIIIIYNNYVIK